MNSKTLNYIFGIIALFALIIAGYFYYELKTQSAYYLQQSQDLIQRVSQQSKTQEPVDASPTVEEHSDWQVYTNKQFGFQFSYPKGYDYTAKENCNNFPDGLSCLVTMQNGYSTLLVETNSPGHGWYSAINPEKGIIKIGDVNAEYSFGRAANEGGEESGTSVFLTTFKRADVTYHIAYLYREAHPGVFMDQIIKPVLESFKFTK